MLLSWYSVGFGLHYYSVYPCRLDALMHLLHCTCMGFTCLPCTVDRVGDQEWLQQRQCQITVLPLSTLVGGPTLCSKGFVLRVCVHSCVGVAASTCSERLANVWRTFGCVVTAAVPWSLFCCLCELNNEILVVLYLILAS